MPQINKIRVANIKYDHNKKQMPDLTFDLQGADSIFLLGNGGGKSLLVQLILQTVLPNQRMGKRRLADLFASASYTGHVAVEWKLDSSGEEEHLLCTGFCFREGRGSKRLEYYNYLIDYTAESEFQLADLPLIKDQNLFDSRQPIKFQELRDWLQKQDNFRIEIFDKIYEYHNRLQQFRILPREWESIARTNGAEGGVDDFFARSKTTSQLLDNLLIPQIKEVLFASDDQDELFAAFSRYRDKLLRMPKIEANIKHFSVISDQAEEIIAEVEQLDNCKQKVRGQKEKLARLKKRLALEVQEAEEKLTKLEQEQQEIKQQKEKLLWQQESHEIFVKELAADKVKQEKAAAEEKLAKLNDKLAELETKTRRLKALRLYNQAQSEQQKIENCQQRLELVNKKAPELKSRLTKVKQALGRAWQQKKEQLEAKASSLKGEIAESKQKIADTKTQITDLEQEKEAVIESKSTVKAWLTDLRQQRERLTDKLAVDSLEAPGKLLAKKEDKLKQEKATIAELKEAIGQLENKREELMDEKLKLSRRQTAVEAEFNKLEQKLAEFTDHQDQLAGMLAKENQYWPDLLDAQEEVISFSRDQLNEVRRAKAKLAAKIANLEEQSALIRDKEYYIPHRVLMEVKEQLAKKDIYSLLGSEWLAEQDIARAEKEKLLDQQPLIPYAIVLESGQLTRARRALASSELPADFPVILLARKELAVEAKGARAGDWQILTESELFISPQSFVEFKEGLEEKLETKQARLTDLKDQEEFLIELRSRAEDFYERYSSEKVAQLKSDLEAAKNKQDQLANQLEQVKEEGAEAKNTAVEKKEELTQHRTKKNQLANEIDKLKQFTELAQQKEAKELKLSETEEKLTQLKSKLKDCQQKQEELTSRLTDLRQNLNQRAKEQEAHQQEYEEYGLAEVDCKPEVEESYRQLKNRYQELENQLNKKQGHRREIKELLAVHRQNLQDRKEQLEELAVEQKWLAENQREVTKQEIKASQQTVEEQAEKVKAQEEEVKGLTEKLRDLEVEATTLAEKVKENFNRPPYREFSPIEPQRELKKIKKNLEQVTEKSKQLKERLETTQKRKEACARATEDLEYELGSELADLEAEVEALSEEKWQELDSAPQEVSRAWRTKLQQIEEQLGEQKQAVDHSFQRYVGRLRNSDTPQVRQFIKNVEQIMEQGKIYNYDYVESRFLNMLEAFEKYQQNYQRELEENKKNMQHLTNQSFRRAKTVYENIIELPKNSRINLYGRRVQVIKIDWEAVLGEAGEEKIYDYLRQVLDDLQELKQTGVSDDELEKKMQKRLRIKNLINVIAPIEECRIRVLKPRDKEVIEQGQLKYFDWSEVARWSGGESYSIYMTMFMVLVSYIRQQIEGRSDVGKTVIADNPFGKASSGHVLETVFEIAQANQIQLICLTAHRQESILLHFPIAYSLQLRSFYGQEVMQADRLESGFYSLPQREN